MTAVVRRRTAAACVALALTSAACGGGAPRGTAAGGARPAARGGSAESVEVTSNAAAPTPAVVAVRPLQRRVTPDVLVVSPKPLPSATVAALRKLTRGGFTTFRSGRAKLGTKPLSVAGVDPSTFRSFAPKGTAESDAVWAGVGHHELVLSHHVAKARKVALGSTVAVNGRPLRVAAFATTLPDVDAVVSHAVADALRLPKPNAVLLTAGSGDPTTLASAARRVAGQAKIHLLTQPKVPYAFLSGGTAARAFGAFSYRWYEDGTIEPDARWVATNIVTVSVPVIGRVTCHRLIVPQLRAALREVEAVGLASTIRSFDGCYVPRFISRDPDRPVSLHTWGIAFDLNAITNQRGIRGDMDMRVVSIFKRWGFRWGGDWDYTDPMHFELGALLNVPG